MVRSAVNHCRGEYLSYPSDDSVEHGFHSCFVIEDSRWLIERHAYEAEYYREAYEFGNNVDDMLTDFSHYLFRFHDDFIEAIAEGIWFEHSEEPFLSSTPRQSDHPALDFPESAVCERFEVDGIVCQIRKNPLPIHELLERSRYCSQSLFHVALELDGKPTVNHRMTLRRRDENPECIWSDFFGRREAKIKGIATQDQVKELVIPYVQQVADRRRNRCPT